MCINPQAERKIKLAHHLRVVNSLPTPRERVAVAQNTILLIVGPEPAGPSAVQYTSASFYSIRKVPCVQVL